MYLTGSYNRNLDAKGRLSLPPAFRKELDERVKVIYAPEKEVDAVYVFTEDTFKVWLDSVFEAKGGYDPTSEEHRSVREWLNGEATTLEIDSASRISLPVRQNHQERSESSFFFSSGIWLSIRRSISTRETESLADALSMRISFGA